MTGGFRTSRYSTDWREQVKHDAQGDRGEKKSTQRVLTDPVQPIDTHPEHAHADSAEEYYGPSY